ncbi:MAG TPA: prepilin-type N-terminal cleavage/methylation domain-containing protein [Opitutaceae bacterium]|nr:prepilin-type N-terminal cleavage/methylation domain-containing protein [Opitutaceae bacterium]
MPTTTSNGRRTGRGFTLVELLLAILILAAVLGPFLAFVSRIPDLNSAIGQQGRSEAWRSFTDQALAAGIDPGAAAALRNGVNPAVPAMPTPVVTRGSAMAPLGGAAVRAIQVRMPATVAETRPGGSGFELGAGTAPPVRTTPAAPLLPIVMQTPVVSPAPGSVLPVGMLTAGGSGTPATTVVSASVLDGGRVHLENGRPLAASTGIGIAAQTVSAADLAQGVGGRAWNEYVSQNAGDKAVILADGRIRWHTQSGGRLLIYEPSPPVSYAYLLNLGTPVMVHNTTEVASGASIDIAYDEYMNVRNGTSALRLDWPQTTKTAFGNTWNTLTVGFNWTFQAESGPFGGDLKSFFGEDKEYLWEDNAAVAAAPVLPPGAVASPANWTLARQTTKLGVPELVTQPGYQGGSYEAGGIEIRAPIRNGERLGRVQSGTTVSTGDTLKVQVEPNP